MHKKKTFSLLFIFSLCIVISLLFDEAVAGKIAKHVLKAGVMNTAVRNKTYGPSYRRRGFPTWTILLLVFGCSSALGLIIFLFCMYRRQQIC